MIGNAAEVGEIDQLIVMGTNKLESELDHAWSIPEHERVMVRQEDII